MPTQTKTQTPGLLQIQKILHIAQDQNFKSGEFILKEGEENPYFYIVMQGEVEITKKTSTGQDKIIAHLKSGEFFGEGALSGHIIKPASAKAITDVQLMTFSYDDFNKLIDEAAETGVEFLQSVLGAVTNRLNQTNIKLLALYEINKLMGVFRDDLNNLGKGLVEKLIAITESRDGIMLLKNPFSETYRTIYTTTAEMDKNTFSEFLKDDLKIFAKDGYQYLLVKLKDVGLLVLRRNKGDAHFEDDHLRMIALVAEQAANTIESASRRAADKAKNILHQKKFVL
ncbi:cyclic nucleotide-binding domain-containing protein [Patescibacteria group bacterium]|nr:cyclic nucleotide-binding domain-containing protein [Patescibacteria group bacterium]